MAQLYKKTGTCSRPSGALTDYPMYLVVGESAGSVNINPAARQYPPAHSDTYVKATSTISANHPYCATNPVKNLVGSPVSTEWTSKSTTNQRFHVDLGSGKVITHIYYENSHSSGGTTNAGAKNFTLWGSNESTAFAELTYGTDTDWTQIGGSLQFDQHTAYNVADPKYIAITNTTAYRYYALKIADNWVYGYYMSLRRIVLLTDEGFVHCSAHCKPDFGDIRFHDATDAALNYMIDWPTLTGTTPNQSVGVWVAPSPGTTDTNVVIKYGDSSLTDASDPSIFDLHEDAEWGDDDDPVTDSGGLVTWIDRTYNGVISTDTAHAGTRSIALNYDATNPISAQPTITVDEGKAIRFWLKRYTNQSYIEFFSGAGDASYGLMLIFDDNDLSVKYKTSATPTDTGLDIVSGAWNFFEIRDINYTAHTATLQVNDATVTVSMRSGVATGGGFWFYGGKAGGSAGYFTYIDDLIVRKYVNPEPTWGTWGEEEAIEATSTGLFDGKVLIKSSTSKQFDGKVVAQSAKSDLFDAEAIVQHGPPQLFDGICTVQHSTTGLFDGLARVQASGTNLFDAEAYVFAQSSSVFDGFAVVQNEDTVVFDGFAVLKSNGSSLFDGITAVQSDAVDLLDGLAQVKKIASNLADGLVKVKSSGVCTFDGSTRVQSDTAQLFDGSTEVHAAPENWELTVETTDVDQTFTVNISAGTSIDITIDWDDGNAPVNYNTTGVKTGTYATAGTYYPKISGSFTNGIIKLGSRLKATGVIGGVTGFLSCALMFDSCTGLTTVPADLFRYVTGLGASAFNSTFKGCSGLVSVPENLFKCNTGAANNAFESTFDGCSALTAAPEGLFRYNTAVGIEGFKNTFKGCSSLTTVPEDLFRYNTAVTSSAFRGTFYECTGLTSIPAGLFQYNIHVSTHGFYQVFKGCTSLTTLPALLFRNNLWVTTSGFAGAFQDCTSLTTLPELFFRYNERVSTSGFSQTFSGCTSLASLPVDLFRYNKLVSTSGFKRTFYGCNKLTLNSRIFYAGDGLITRFASPVPTQNFTECFKLTGPFTGVQGTAPAMWDYTFNGTPTSTDCFDGHSAESVTNYYDIPKVWGGPEAVCDTGLFDGIVKVQSRTTKLFDGSAVVKSAASTLFDGSAGVQYSDSDLFDGSAVVKSVGVKIFDGLVTLGSGGVSYFDGLTQVQSGAVGLFDGSVSVQDSVIGNFDGSTQLCIQATGVFDSLGRVKSSGSDLFDGSAYLYLQATGVFDGLVVVQDVATNLFDGEVSIVVAGSGRSYFDGLVVLGSEATSVFDGSAGVQSVGADNFDGLAEVQNCASSLFDGSASVKDSGSLLFGGIAQIGSIASVLFDGAAKLQTSVSGNFDGAAEVASAAELEFDGACRISSTGEELFDGSAQVQLSTAGLFDGCVGIVYCGTSSFDGLAVLKDETTGLFDGLVELEVPIPENLFDGKFIVARYVQGEVVLSFVGSVPYVSFTGSTALLDIDGSAITVTFE